MDKGLPSFPPQTVAVPREVERLLNPAYCALILARYVQSYSAARGGISPSMPFPLLYLLFPLVLPADSRIGINHHQGSFGLHRFVRAHQHVLVGLPERIQGFRTIAHQALTFAVNYELLALDSQSSVLVARAPSRSHVSNVLDSTSMEPWRAADRLGTWCGQLSVTEAFLHLGLHP